MRIGLVGGAAAVAALACSPEALETEPPVVQPIVGGSLATACQWPTTVLLPNAGCSGTLIHPLIIVTAAHCGTSEKIAIMGESRSTPARTMAIEYCKTFQGRAGPTPTDYAFCKLRLPVTDVPIVPVLMGCETEVLVPGQPVVVAGFGDSSRLGGFGVKRWVETSIVKVGGPRGIQVGGMGKAPCFGDSGGPAFVTLPDGSWRVFGIDSAGIAQGCDAGDVMALMDDAVPWIEEQSGIDVTPCTDADGTWNPSSACRNFSMAPHSEGRTWTSGCAEAALSPPLASCGAAYEPTDGGAGDASPTDARKGIPLHGDAAGATTDDSMAFRPRVHSQGCAVGGVGAAWPWLAVLAILLRRLWAARGCG